MKLYSTQWIPTGLSGVEKKLHRDYGNWKLQPVWLLAFFIVLYVMPNYEHCVCRDGNVSLQEYMAFMISRETENVKSSEEIESAFRALSTENKPYVTKEELYQVRAVHCSFIYSFRSSYTSNCLLLPFRT